MKTLIKTANNYLTEQLLFINSIQRFETAHVYV